jgi:DNA-binding cell septation regulator SpoVG
MARNAGVPVTNLNATVPKCGEVWHALQAINVFSLNKTEQKHQITCDTNKDSAFVVHMLDKQVRFLKGENGLCCHKPSHNTKTNPKASFVGTIEENKRFFMDQEFQRAKRARESCHTMGTPSLTDFKAIICMNCVKDYLATLQDIGIVEIFCPDMGSIKDKATRLKPITVALDHIEIPKELVKAQQDVTMCVDTMKINGIPFS